jgi:hypothetical protein
MPKALPPATLDALKPPPTAFPYSFFERVDQHPFEPGAGGLSLRNAWWLMDAAFLSYSPEADIRQAFDRPLFGSPVAVRFFFGLRSTQCYVASNDEWIVLSFRGTQVDDFWASVIDWSVDARFVPIADGHGDAVHAGFLSATLEVWPAVAAHLRALQTERERPLWITGHSLGAALATVAANLCSDHPDQLGLLSTCTYGSPRVGDRHFGRRIQRPLWRFRNDSDIVTHVPLGLVFRHAGVLALVDAAGHFHADPSPAEEALFEAATARFSAGDAQHVSALVGGAEPHMRLPGILADHAPINYAIRLWNCYEAS